MAGLKSVRFIFGFALMALVIPAMAAAPVIQSARFISASAYRTLSLSSLARGCLSRPRITWGTVL